MHSQAEIEMFGQLDTVRHPVEVGLGLLPVVMATVIAPAATADDIGLVPLMTADLVVFADLQFWKHLLCSPRP